MGTPDSAPTQIVGTGRPDQAAKTGESLEGPGEAWRKPENRMQWGNPGNWRFTESPNGLVDLCPATVEAGEFVEFDRMISRITEELTISSASSGGLPSDTGKWSDEDSEQITFSRNLVCRPEKAFRENIGRITKPQAMLGHIPAITFWIEPGDSSANCGLNVPHSEFQVPRGGYLGTGKLDPDEFLVSVARVDLDIDVCGMECRVQHMA
ncbi:hypothetical protein N7468_000312 [Penicillium chermesinum]|uniref:Uncharacterized protein n=1 Tax=Penicillium chermesinum TaxID=63820 RepID=A0A9W9PK30_9EURO|nr:uncharacterized protein N7468_000312 [Penicillium chermesinum]KAJ5248861.1 hypothetical protein N7468_000312 [Penicillium chermesinum]